MNNIMLKIVFVTVFVLSIYAQDSIVDSGKLKNELDDFKAKMPDQIKMIDENIKGHRTDASSQKQAIENEFKKNMEQINAQRKEAGIGFSIFGLSEEKSQIKENLDARQRQLEENYEMEMSVVEQSLAQAVDKLESDKAELKAKGKILEEQYRDAVKIEKEIEKQKASEAKELAKQEAEKLKKEQEAKEIERKEKEMAPYKEAENALNSSLEDLSRREAENNNTYKTAKESLVNKHEKQITEFKEGYETQRKQLSEQIKINQDNGNKDKAEALKVKLASLNLSYEVERVNLETEYESAISVIENNFNSQKDEIKAGRLQAKAAYESQIDELNESKKLAKRNEQEQLTQQKEARRAEELEKKQKAIDETRRIESAVQELDKERTKEIDFAQAYYEQARKQIQQSYNSDIAQLDENEKAAKQQYKSSVDAINSSKAPKSELIKLEEAQKLDLSLLAEKYENENAAKKQAIKELKSIAAAIEKERKIAIKEAEKSDGQIDVDNVKQEYDDRLAKVDRQIDDTNVEIAVLKQDYRNSVKEIETKYNAQKTSLATKTDTDSNEALVAQENTHNELITSIAAKRQNAKAEYANQIQELDLKYQDTIQKINMKYDYLAKEASIRTDCKYEDSGNKFAVSGINLSGNSLISTEDIFKSLPASYNCDMGGNAKYYDFTDIHKIINKQADSVDITVATLQGLTRYVLDVYNKKYSGIFVYVPADSIQDGRFINNVLQIKIIEGKLSSVDVSYKRILPGAEMKFEPLAEGEKGKLNKNTFLSWSPLNEGQPVDKKKVDDFVNLLNQRPDIYVQPVLSKGAQDDTLSMNYDLYEMNPWHIIAQMDNTGSDERQWNPVLGAINTNLFGFTDTLSAFYQGPLFKHTSEAFEENYSVFGSYEFPIFSPRLRAQFYTAHSGFDTNSEELKTLFFRGSGDVSGAKMIYNLGQFDKWFFDITGSISTENSRVNQSIGVDSDLRMNMLGGGLSLSKRDEKIDARYGFDFFNNYSGSKKAEFDKARQDAEPDFDISMFSLKHYQYLDDAKINRMKIGTRYILPSQRLVPAKMTSFGGMDTVRGYEEDEIVADGGLNINLQYEFDLVPYINKSRNIKNAGNKYLNFNKFALAGFTDYGRSENQDPVPGETRRHNLWSAGVGTVFTINKYFDGEVYYGVPIKETDDTDTGEGRWNVRFIYRW